MFTVEIRINGSLISHIYGQNRGMIGELTNYAYEYYEPETRNLKKGTVQHDRDAGIIPLITKILSQQLLP